MFGLSQRKRQDIFVRVAQDLCQMMYEETGNAHLFPNLDLTTDKREFVLKAYEITYKFKDWTQYSYLRDSIRKLINNHKEVLSGQ